MSVFENFGASRTCRNEMEATEWSSDFYHQDTDIARIYSSD